MTDAVLDRMLGSLHALPDSTRRAVAHFVDVGRDDLALKALYDGSGNEVDTPGVGGLVVYLLHRVGEYEEANRWVDFLSGLNLCETFNIHSCPDEESIIKKWDPKAAGISVLCPTFNHERFINMALSGIFRQNTRHPFEVIVRNDASSDGTSAHLRSWEMRYPRILKVIETPENTYRKGVPPFPATLAFSEFDFVAVCEGDDFWIDSNKLETQIGVFESDSKLVGVFHNHLELNEWTGMMSRGRLTTEAGLVPSDDLRAVKFVIWLHTLMFRKSCVWIPDFDLRDGVLGDQVLTAALGHAGPVRYLGKLLGSVARRNLSSTYTPLSDEEKDIKRFHTRNFIRLMRWPDGNLRTEVGVTVPGEISHGTV